MIKGGSEVVEEIRKLIVTDKLIFGTERALKFLRRRKLQKIIIASNCNEQTKDDLSRYCEMAGIDCIEIAQVSDEIGVLCRKPFAISVVGVLA